MRHRIYKLNDGRVIVDTPSNRYQNEHFDACPHPWRFRDGNPDKESYTLEVITSDELHAITQGKNESGSLQFYYDSTNTLKHDHDWDNCIMSNSAIVKRHRATLEAELDNELAKPNPDPVKVVKKDRELKKLGKLSKKETYQLALSKLEAQNKKPKIQEKLRSLIERET